MSVDLSIFGSKQGSKKTGMIDNYRYNVLWLIAEKLLRVITGALVSAVLARYLGPEGYGSIAISIGVVAIAVAAANMGADHIHVSEFAQRTGADGTAFLGSALLVRLGWSLVCLLLLWVPMAWLNVNHSKVVMILSAAVPISVFTILTGKIQGSGAFGTYSILSCLSIAFGALLRIAGIWLGASLEFFAAVFVAEAAFLALLLLGWYQSTSATSLFELRTKRALAVSYFKMCFPTALSATLIVVYLRFELFMVDVLIGKAAAGIWSAALMFTVPWGMVASSILSVANRRLAIFHGVDFDYECKLVKLLRWMLMLAVAAALINCAAVVVLAPLLLGPKFDAVVPIVFITSISFVPLFSGTVQELWIAHRRSTGTVLKKVLVGLPVSAVLYYAIVPTHGLCGASVAMVLSYFFTAFPLNWVFDKPYFRIQLRAMGFNHV
jgi:PST family polysaccharide transporter